MLLTLVVASLARCHCEGLLPSYSATVFRERFHPRGTASAGTLNKETRRFLAALYQKRKNHGPTDVGFVHGQGSDLTRTSLSQTSTPVFDSAGMYVYSSPEVASPRGLSQPISDQSTTCSIDRPNANPSHSVSYLFLSISLSSMHGFDVKKFCLSVLLSGKENPLAVMSTAQPGFIPSKVSELRLANVSTAFALPVPHLAKPDRYRS